MPYLKGQYPQVLWSILLVGKLLQIFGFFLLPALACIKLHQFNASNTSHNYGSPATVCRRVLLDVRGIVRVLEVFVQLLGLRLAL